ncbi:MAG: 2-vinyl bacteriochlorophyllide hydratase [Pseudomonadota bacterium]
MGASSDKTRAPLPIYTAEQRRRRDASPWTLVQAVLAPLQFLVFLFSLALVLRYFATGAGEALAAISIVVKTLVLYTIMVTGAWWEKDVFGQYLFARPFFWEDVVSMAVMVLHTLYVAMLLGGIGTPAAQFVVALVAYAFYVINAVQFFWKFRVARRLQTQTLAEVGVG